MALVVRRKRPAGATSAAATCGSACASDTTIPSFASRIALATFSGVIRLVVPLDSCPTGAHLPQVLNSVRQRSYWARSAAVSGGATGAGEAGAGCPCACISTASTMAAATRPAHAVTEARRFRARRFRIGPSRCVLEFSNGNLLPSGSDRKVQYPLKLGVEISFGNGSSRRAGGDPVALPGNARHAVQLLA